MKHFAKFKELIKSEEDLTRDAYLKYEEGEVKPVKQVDPNYPPFLNEKGSDKESFVLFKDLEGSKVSDVITTPRTSLSSTKTNVELEVDENINNVEKQDEKNTINPIKFAKPLLWTAILGGMMYYSIPILHQFVSETNLSELSTDVTNTVDTANQISETVEEGTEKISNTAGEVKDNVKETLDEGSGIKDVVTQSLNSGVQSIQETVQSSEVSQTDISWLSSIESIHNQKQLALLELQDITVADIEGSLSHSAYKLKVQGIDRKIDKLQEKLVQITQSSPSDSTDIINIVSNELNDMDELTTNLAASGERNVSTVFDSGVETQNNYTSVYSSSFKSLLKSWGVPYTENSGIIEY